MTKVTTALDKVLELSMLVTADMDRFEQESGLTGPRIRVLWILGHGGPITQRALATALDVTPRNVTGLVDGLVASEHVTREPHPTDRRATLVTPTAAGRRVIRQLVESHADLAAQLFGSTPSRDLAAFVTMLDTTIETFGRLMGEAT